jgi:hypothetical protein
MPDDGNDDYNDKNITSGFSKNLDLIRERYFEDSLKIADVSWRLKVLKIRLIYGASVKHYEK